jgi:hypothetical protein
MSVYGAGYPGRPDAALNMPTGLTGTTYTTVNSDFAGQVVKRISNASAITVTVASGTTNKQSLMFVQMNAGAITIVPAAGVTLYAANGVLATRAQYGWIKVIPLSDAADTYLVVVEDAVSSGAIVISSPADITISTYTVLNTDLAGQIVQKFSAATAQTITVPTGLTNKQPWTVINKGAGQVVFAAAAGVTINSADSKLKLRVQFSSATLIPDTTADTYYLVGDLTT